MATNGDFMIRRISAHVMNIFTTKISISDGSFFPIFYIANTNNGFRLS